MTTPISQRKARELTAGYDADGWIRRTEYPSDHPLVAGTVHTADRKIIILYDDRSYLVIAKARPRRKKVWQ